MGAGKLDQRIEIVRTHIKRNGRGFRDAESESDDVIANVWAYKEPRRATEVWANRATYSEATHLFRFRVIPGVEITTDMVIVLAGKRYDILSAEGMGNRKMYVEALAKLVSPSKGV